MPARMSLDAVLAELERQLDSTRDLPHRVVIPVLGIPVAFAANDPGVVRLVEGVFGAWRNLATARQRIEPGAPADRAAGDRPVNDPSLAFEVVEGREGEEGGDGHAPISYHLPGADRLLIVTPGSRAMADAERGRAVARVTRSLVADRDHFRYSVLESLAIFLLCARDRQPLHAAALVRDDTALLLAGRSGVGKSTLAYAGARAGLKVLAEDVVYVQRSPAPRVWGMPGFIHLSPESIRWFPELSAHRPTLRANGKVKVAVDLHELGAVPSVPVADRVGICLLRRDGSEPGLRRLRPDEVEAALTLDIEPGFDLFSDTIGAAVREMIGDLGGWRLDMAGSPAGVVERLVSIMDELDATGGG